MKAGEIFTIGRYAITARICSCLAAILASGPTCALGALTYLSDERVISATVSTSKFDGQQAYDSHGNPIATSFSQTAVPSEPFADFNGTAEVSAQWYRLWPDHDPYQVDSAYAYAMQSSILTPTRIVGSGGTSSGLNGQGNCYAESILETTFIIGTTQPYTLSASLYNSPGAGSLFTFGSVNHGTLYSFGFGVASFSDSFSGVLEPDTYTIRAWSENDSNDGYDAHWNFDFALPVPEPSTFIAGALLILFSGIGCLWNRKSAK